jgi:hypothetical protein
MKGIRTGGLAVALGLGVLVGLATPASAATVSKYHPSGWHAAVEYGPGLCNPNVNCPTVTNTRSARGGVGGAGYLRTKLSGLTGVAAQSRGIWRSSPFRYRGVHGKPARWLSLTVARRSQVAALLSAAGNSANYTVEIVRQDNGVARAPIDHRKVKQTPNWTRVTVGLRPRALQVGRSYSIRITTEFNTGAAVFPNATADYSGIAVRALRQSRGHRPVAHNKRLRIRVPCPRKYRSGRCKIKTVAVRHRHGPAITRAGHARVRAGHRKVVTMRVRPRYLHWVKTHHRVLVRERLRTHKRVHRFYRHYRIIHR